jgi:uracil-DNA glycosylase family 4
VTSLPVIRDEGCTRCKLHSTTTRVCTLSEPKRAKVMVLGEAPGQQEEKTGILFNGRSGQLLWRELARVGIDRENVYVANAVSCRPPDNRTPKKAEIKACSHWVNEQVKLVQPKFVLVLGNVPLISLTGSAGIKKQRGRAFEKNGVIYLPTWHPSYVLRDDKNLGTFAADLRLFARIIKEGRIPKEDGLNWVIVNTPERFERMLADISGTVSFDVETTSLYQWDQGPLERNPNYPGRVRERGVVSLGIGTKNHQWCLPMLHPGSPWKREQLEQMVKQLDEKMQDCIIVAHNGKFDALWMMVKHCVQWRPDFDTMLAHYMLDENSRHGLKILSQVYYNAPNYDDDDVKLKTGEAGLLEDHCLYLAHDVYYTRKLRFTLGKMLDEDWEVNRVFERIMMPLATLFIDIEYHGAYVDLVQFHKVEKQLRLELKAAEDELKKFGDINWRSTKQLAELFFGTLGMKPLDRTKKGAASTSESVLLRLDHPAAKALMKYRGVDQLLKMFIDGWKPFLGPDGRMHPSFKLHGTVTARASCEHPNLQQVPRLELIRSLITAPDGWVLLEMDLSQIEMRIAGELSGDQVLIGAFDKDEDVHWLTAIREVTRGGGMKEEFILTAEEAVKKGLAKSRGQVIISKGRQLGISYAEATKIVYELGPDLAASLLKTWKEVRKKAKAVNFGYLFGMWWKKFIIYARDNYGVHVTDKQAQDSRKAFFGLYSALEGWHQRQKRYARRHGYVRSLSGRKRRLPAAMSQHDSPERGEAERQAVNSPVQSFACDLNFMVLMQLVKEFGLNVLRPIGTVHDATLMEVRVEMLWKVASRALEVMQHPEMLDEFDIKLRVPIKGDVKVGPWGKGIDLEKWLEANRPQDLQKLSASRKAKSTPGDAVSKSTTTSTSRSSSVKRRKGRLRLVSSSTK